MKFFRDLLLSFAAMCAAFALIECGLRLAHARLEASFFDSDNERVYVLRPNAEGWSTTESEVYIKINSDGMRDIERPLARSPHTLRVAVIGASEAEAAQVPLNETFEAVMTREISRTLRERGWNVEVLNFGVDGYTPAQAYLTLQNHVWKYDPQVVIFLFSAWTVQKTVRDFYPEQMKLAPAWVLENGKLVPDEITRNMPRFDEQQVKRRGRMVDVMNRSFLLTLLHAAALKAEGLPNEWLAKLEKPADAKSNAKDSAPSTVAIDLLRSYNPDRPELREAWAITEAFFKTMKENCEQHGAEFWVVPADQAMQVDPSLRARTEFEKRMGIDTLDASDERVQRFGEVNGIGVFAPAHILGEYAVTHGTYVHGLDAPMQRSHHWNKVGQEVVGEAIAHELLEHSATLRNVGATGAEK